MLIQGSPKTNKQEHLVQEYTKLLEQGIDAEKILVLVQNPYKKSLFIEKFKKITKITHYEEPQIYTFLGLIYNTILSNWALIQNEIQIGNDTVQPNLTGMEVSQLFFKKAIKEAGFKDYNSKINLYHQLFRRYSLIVNNNLTTKEITERSKILNEVFFEDTQQALENYKKLTIEYKAFDYIRQTAIFSHIYKKYPLFQKIEYLIIDDADEITPNEIDFIKHLKPQLKQVHISYDKYGSTRLGFLNTDINTVDEIKKLFSKEETLNLDDIQTPNITAEVKNFSKRIESLKELTLHIKSLLAKEITPNEIAIITPNIDNTLKFTLIEELSSHNIKYKFFSGSEKLYDTPIVQNTITLLKLSLNEENDPYKLRGVLNKTLKIPTKYCVKIIQNYKSQDVFSSNIKDIPDKYNKAIETLINTLNTIQNPNLKLSDKIYEIYDKVINLNFDELDQLSNFNFFIKQIQDFEQVFGDLTLDKKFQKSIITQLENSIISQNQSSAPDIEDSSIIITTPQKIIDLSLSTKYQFWLDISSSNWVKDDIGTLYNSWVFQKSWDKQEFKYEDNIEFSTIKTQKILRKLSLLCKEKIYAYSSFFDTEGNENFGGIEKYIKTQHTTQEHKKFEFTPRVDQKPILEYTQGKMAISAVPGAGKTTILLALIIKLLNNGIKSENIFVMTYMDSAAKNFKERIQKACPNLEKIPNISTIHGLALKILKENSNYVKASLNENFEICDDNTRQKIIKELIYKLKLEQDDYEKYEKAISSLKLSNTKTIPPVKDKELQNFVTLYKTYLEYLKQQNTIDYDDMLVICVKILEENEEIRKYYQNLCQYVIEDEAQDSSYIQQKLLNILSDQHKNLIRCGDINQAITTSFANTDLDGFKNFTKENNNITMNYSQRCSKDVYNLANELIDYSKKFPDYENAFFDIKMTEVKGKNPTTPNGVINKVFDTQNDENEYIIEQIKTIQKNSPNATIAILVRYNRYIEEYAKMLNNYGFNVITNNDCLGNQPAYLLALNLLKFCEKPMINQNIIDLAEFFKKNKLLKLTNQDIDLIKNLKAPFILENQDTIQSSNLNQLLWDLNYWLENTTLPIEDFTIKSGYYYFNTDVEKSNTNIIALLLKKLSNQYKTQEALIERLEIIATKAISNVGKYSFFTDEKTDNQQNSIQIMTYHKSKGDEFDYVFLPGLCEENLAFKSDNIKIKSNERFNEAVKALNSNYTKKDEKELKLIQIHENLRLLYVAITRAKQKLYITAAKKQKIYNKFKNATVSQIFNDILDKSNCGDNNAK